jgi:hypothetical protein
MLTFEDCMALSELTPEEIAAIAEHEHVPEMVAAELGCYLLHRAGGAAAIRRMLVEDIEAVRARGDIAHVAKLKLVLRHFCEAHRAALEAGAEAAP